MLFVKDRSDHHNDMRVTLSGGFPIFNPSFLLRFPSEVNMRRLVTGAAFAICFSTAPKLALASNAALNESRSDDAFDQPDSDADADNDEDLVLEDESPEEAATEEAPASDFTPDPSFLETDSKSDSPSGTSKPSTGDDSQDGIEIDQDALDKKMITVVSYQPMLNIYKKDGESKGYIRRLDIQPQVGLGINDPYVRHWAVGGELNWWLTNRMALGGSATAFLGQRTPNYNRVRQQQGILMTANRFIWQASLNFLYEPFYGKIALFNRALLHWESYVQLGGGVIQTTVIPRFSNLHDPFRHILPQGNFALGARFYVPGAQFISFNFGVRTWIFQDRYEPLGRGPNSNPNDENATDEKDFDDPKAAKAAADKRMAYNSIFFFGVSFYLPPSFQYSTRR